MRLCTQQPTDVTDYSHRGDSAAIRGDSRRFVAIRGDSWRFAAIRGDLLISDTLFLCLSPIFFRYCAGRAAFYCRIIAHWRSGQEELEVKLRLWFEGDDVKGMM